MFLINCNFSGLSDKLEKTPRVYYIGILDNLPFDKTLHQYNAFYDLVRCELNFIKVNGIP